MNLLNNKVSLKNIYKSFIYDSNKIDVLHDINLYAGENEFVSILGPSGCGKSTILRLIAGLESTDGGEITVRGKAGYMHQKDLLMPWLTVYKNIVLPLEISKTVDERKKEVEQLIEEFGLSGFEDFYPDRLSGGMRQRAAFLRTFLTDSDILLLDEPFGALDAITRSKMQDWLLKVWRHHMKTVIFVTHDVDEAIHLSDRIYVMNNRPATFILHKEVNIERPRKKDIYSDQRFIEIKKEISQSMETA